MQDSSARALVDHWDWAAQKGLMNRGTAQSMAVACRRVLSVQENWENLDVRSLDIEEYLIRFTNLKAKDFSPNSLRDYESRFRRAVGSFREYLDDPSGWKFPSRSSSSREPLGTRRKKSQSEPSPTETRIEDGSGRAGESAGGSQEYSYPFRPDVLARLSIPRDSTSAEINRLVAWARTLAVDYEPSS